MNRFLFAGIEALAAAIVLIPVFLLLKNRLGWGIRRTVCYIAFSLYLAGVYTVTGLPNITFIRFEPNLNFEPFAYMFSDWENTFLNVVLFLPLGFVLPICWQNFNPFWKTILLGFGFSLLIETLQIFTFRASDINDLMTNTMGALLGWMTARQMLFAAPGLVPGKNTKEFYYLCIVTFAVMFFLHPFLSNLVWSILL